MYLEYNFEQEEEIKKWNFGAMFLPLIWGPCNKCYITLTCLIPFLLPMPVLFNAYAAIILHLWFGMYGNKWALENKNWENLEEFARVQQNWNIAGFIAVGFVLFAPLLTVLFD